MGAGNDSFIFVDPNLGSAGGAGTALDPRDSLANAHPLMVNRRAIFLVRDPVQTLGALDWTNVQFEGPESHGAANASAIALNAQSVAGSIFNGLSISGDAAASSIAANDCAVSAVTNVAGRFRRCVMAGTMALSAPARFENCQGSGTNIFELDLTAITGAQIIELLGFKGFVRITNLADAAARLEITGEGIEVELAASVTSGTVVLRGTGKLINNSAPVALTIDKSGLVNRDEGEIQINARYVDSTDALFINAWLERDGSIPVSTTQGSATIYDENGTLIVASGAVANSDAQGVFRFPSLTVPAGAGSDTMVYAVITMNDEFGALITGITGITIRPES